MGPRRTRHTGAAGLPILVLSATLLGWSCLPLSVAGPARAEAAQDSAGHVDLVCELVWEAPGETEDYLFGGLLIDAGWDHQGNLCIVDYRNKDLKVFSADGRYLRTLGRAGDGPGESRDARRLLLADDGRLGLLQVFPASVVWLHPDGAPGGKLSVKNTHGDQGGFVAVTHAVQQGSSILAYATMMAMTAGRINEQHWIAPLNPDGTLGRPLFEMAVDQPERDARNRVDEGDYYDVWAARWAPDGRGGVWVAAERDQYLLTRFDASGVAVQTLHLPYDQIARDELGRRQALEHLGRKRLAADEVKLRDHAPVVRSLRLSDTGDLWVDLDLGGRGPGPQTIAWVDVIDPSGEYRHQFRLHGPYDPETDQWRWVDDEHLLVLHAGSEDEVSLRLLRRR